MMRSRRRPSQPQTRGGFTLIELLVVISIIAVLMSLILPAIQNAREAGRRTQCLNNLKNLGLAAHNYANSRKGRLPAYGYWLDRNLEGRSWVVELLPYLDQQGLYDRWNKQRRWNDPTPGVGGQSNLELSQTYLTVLVCPDDQSSFQVDGGLSYVVNTGYGDNRCAPFNPGSNISHCYNAEPIDFDGDGITNTLAMPGQDPEDAAIIRDTGMFWGEFFTVPNTKKKSQSLENIYDGAANTILMTENLNAGMPILNWASPDPRGCTVSYPVAPNTGPADFDDPAPGPASTWQMAGPFINQHKAGAEGKAPFPSSLHPGGVNIVNSEGGARFLSEDIEPIVYKRLLTPNGTRLRASLTTFEPEAPLSDADF